MHERLQKQQDEHNALSPGEQSPEAKEYLRQMMKRLAKEANSSSPDSAA